MTTSTGEAKAALRRRMRMVRDLVDDRTLRSVGLWAALAARPAYAQAQVVVAFASTAAEPDTDSLLARLAADGKTIALPSVEDGLIVPRLIGAGLRAGRYGIREPQGERVPVSVVDLVVVPGLAFTTSGRRLGQGGGHYDRFLASLPPTCTSVGVCFAEQLVDDLPWEDHDVAVDEVISDGSGDDPGDGSGGASGGAPADERPDAGLR